jgi:amidase
VAVAAGFTPLALGTETIGSIVTPASRAGLYALKPTVGVQDTAGLYTLTDFFDSPGLMAKSAEDVMLLTDVLLGGSLALNSDRLKLSDGLAVGFLDPAVWKMSDGICRQHEDTAEQMVRSPFEVEATKCSLMSSPADPGVRECCRQS